MLLGALGDIHGDFASVRRIQARHPEVGAWLCVGDVADDAGRYEPFAAPVHFIKGNNDGFDAIAGGALPDNVHFIAERASCTWSAGCGWRGWAARSRRPGTRRRPRDLPHPRQGHGARDRAGRQAAALRARGGRRVPGAERQSTCS